MDDYDRQAYRDDGEDPDDPVIVARHEFMLRALRDYGVEHGMRRQCPPALAD